MKFAISMFILALVSWSAASIAAEPPAPLAYQLALKPLALVKGDACEVRGAVWAYGPRADVAVELVSADGQVIKTTTNGAGIYAASIPYAGTTLAFQERIADEVRVRADLADKARGFSPSIVCSVEQTAAFLSLNSATGNKDK
jgi:hypothetical protein